MLKNFFKGIFVSLLNSNSTVQTLNRYGLSYEVQTVILCE